MFQFPLISNSISKFMFCLNNLLGVLSFVYYKRIQGIALSYTPKNHNQSVIHEIGFPFNLIETTDCRPNEQSIMAVSNFVISFIVQSIELLTIHTQLKLQ